MKASEMKSVGSFKAYTQRIRLYVSSEDPRPARRERKLTNRQDGLGRVGFHRRRHGLLSLHDIAPYIALRVTLAGFIYNSLSSACKSSICVAVGKCSPNWGSNFVTRLLNLWAETPRSGARVEPYFMMRGSEF